MGVSHSTPHERKTVWFDDFEANLPSLEGKVVAITGCTSGTGLVAAETSVRKGASTVLMLNRPSERAKKALETVKSSIPADAKTVVEGVDCDLQDFESVRAAASTIKGKYEAVDVLCNNAGVMALDDKATKDGYDVQIQTNNLSHFLLTKELFPLLKKAQELRGEARVVHHSSAARKHPNGALEAKYFEKNGGNLGGDSNGTMWTGAPRWIRYHQSKLGNTVITKALADRFGDSGIKATVAAPGLAATNLQVTTAQSGGMGWSEMFIMHFAQSAQDGTMPLLAACFDPAAENGDFYEPAHMGNIKGPAVKVEYDALSKDEEARKMLWEKCEAVFGTFDI